MNDQQHITPRVTNHLISSTLTRKSSIWTSNIGSWASIRELQLLVRSRQAPECCLQRLSMQGTLWGICLSEWLKELEALPDFREETPSQVRWPMKSTPVEIRTSLALRHRQKQAKYPTNSICHSQLWVEAIRVPGELVSSSSTQCHNSHCLIATPLLSTSISPIPTATNSPRNYKFRATRDQPLPLITVNNLQLEMTKSAESCRPRSSNRPSVLFNSKRQQIIHNRIIQKKLNSWGRRCRQRTRPLMRCRCGTLGSRKVWWARARWRSGLSSQKRTWGQRPPLMRNRGPKLLFWNRE